jgi:tetratricopeptide (TPR) repeat protein
MGDIVPFPAKQPSKFGFERVRKRGKENPDQLNLFSARLGEVLRFPANISPFEEAVLMDERDDSRAEKLYRRAISDGDFVADAYCNLGIIESRAGRITKAFDCFTKALEHDPRHFESHYNLGNLYFEDNNLRLARMHFELAAEINPAFPNLYFNMGLVLALLEERKAAIAAFTKYQLLAPQEERRNADDLISGLRRSLAASGQNTVP